MRWNDSKIVLDATPEGNQPSAQKYGRSAAAYKLHDFQVGPVGNSRAFPIAFADDGFIQFHGYPVALDLQVLKQRRNRLIAGNLPRFSIHRNADKVRLHLQF